MNLYTLYKIDSHFKLFYNFNTGKFDKRENKLTSEHFCISETYCKNIRDKQDCKENLKDWGLQHYSYINKITII